MKTKKIPKNEFSLNAIPRDEQKCIPACHTFYMSYDKNVKRMASMHICLHTSLHGYFFIKLQLHFHTTMNQYVNKSIRQRIIDYRQMPLDSTFKDRYVMVKFCACHLGVYLCCGDIRVTKNLAHTLYRHIILQG